MKFIDSLCIFSNKKEGHKRIEKFYKNRILKEEFIYVVNYATMNIEATCYGGVRSYGIIKNLSFKDDGFYGDLWLNDNIDFKYGELCAVTLDNKIQFLKYYLSDKKIEV